MFSVWLPKEPVLSEAGRTRNDLVARFLSPEQIVTCAHQFLRDNTEIRQYQTVLIIHRHVNRLKLAD